MEVTVDVSKFSTKKQQQLLKMLNDKSVRVHINTILSDAINPFVPFKTGELRKSVKVKPDAIVWSGDYAHYQYEGEVYGPNKPGIEDGDPAWRSSKGEVSKYPTGREIGVPGTAYLIPRWGLRKRLNLIRNTAVGSYVLYTFGYGESGTGHHWDELFNKDTWSKNHANLEITRYLKSECRRRGLRT